MELINRDFILKRLFIYVKNNKAKVELNLPKYLVLSAIGARVCYSQKIEYNDPRLNEEIIDYLERLSKWTHYSVFAHTPVTVEISKEEFIENEFYNLFKMVYKDGVMYLNLRHIMEAYANYGAGNIKSIIKDFYGTSDYIPNLKTIRDLDIIKVENITYVKSKPYWDFFYIEDIPTPIAVHFIRHVTLNFNARSFRYTKIKENEPPETLVEGLIDRYSDKISNVEELARELYGAGIRDYKKALEAGMATEDARMFSPQGIGTNLVISGFSNDVNKMLSERQENASQHFTRKIAERMKHAKLEDNQNERNL